MGVPASTLKTLNTLISLEGNAIPGKDDRLSRDGHLYDYPEWNHDQTLAVEKTRAFSLRLVEA